VSSVRAAALAAVAIATVAAVRTPAHAAGAPRPATFALVIGVNHSVDRDAEVLQYADDDAAQYFELFRSLGARTYLLTDLDPDDRKLYPQAAAEAVPPTEHELGEAVARLAGDLGRARAAGIPTVMYVVYAGHGNVGPDGGYIALSDARLTGPDIRQRIVDAAAADRTHLIVDACYSYLLAVGRGPGGSRRELHGFSALGKVFDDSRVGLLLSTSSARVSHEWQGIQAGVFSYEVRAGLQGAADADGDGLISYREIAAFVARANEAIANPAYRPDVFARAPTASSTLLDIRVPPADRLGIDAGHAGHYVVEDGRGVRLAEFHSARDQRVELVRRRDAGKLFVRDLDDGKEIAVDLDAPAELASLPSTPIALASRGASDEVFGALFELPFDRDVVDRYRAPEPADVAVVRDESTSHRQRRVLGWVSLATTGALAIAAGASAWSAHDIRDAIAPGSSQVVVLAANQRIRTRDDVALATGIAGGVAAIAGAALLFWPDAGRGIVIVPAATGASIGARLAF
jgi:hypothetical protein